MKYLSRVPNLKNIIPDSTAPNFKKVKFETSYTILFWSSRYLIH